MDRYTHFIVPLTPIHFHEILYINHLMEEGDINMTVDI